MLLKIINRLLPLLIKRYKGKSAYQPFFERMQQWALSGMQIGGGTTPQTSGEVEVLFYIKQKLSQTDFPVLFDVGANIGNYTQLINNIFGNHCSIYSFEPSAHIFTTLQSAVCQLAQVHCVQAGMGSMQSQVQLFTNKQKPGLSSVYQRKLDHLNISLPDSEWVTIKTIDLFCQDEKIERIEFLKLDVEGHELEVLKGAKKMIESGKIRFIQFEFGGCNIDSRTYLQDFYYFLTPRYRLFRIVRDGLFPIDSYKENYEAFNTTNFLAELQVDS